MYYDDVPPALGVVVTEGRGSLPFLLVHGEALAAAAAWSMGEAGISMTDASVPWADVVEEGATVVLHDALCPLTPPEFLNACVEASRAHDRVVVGFRPVTDTIKHLHEDTVGATVDRTELRAVCSPIVLPPHALAGLSDFPEDAFEHLAAALAARTEVRWEEAPATARRVGSVDDVRLLEALGQSTGQG